MARRERGFDWVRDDVDEQPREPVERPNRSEEKRIAQRCEALALEILKLPSSGRARIPVDEHVRAAIEDLARQGPTPSRRRQLLVVKRLLADCDLEAIQAELAGDGVRDQTLRVLDRWRSRLIEGGDEALQGFVDAYPEADRQRIRTLAKLAGGEGAKAAAATKTLFAALREAAGV